MLCDAAVMCGGKISYWLDLSVLLCLIPALEVQHWLQLDRGGSPAQGKVCMCGCLHLAVTSCQTTGMFQASDSAPSFFRGRMLVTGP